MKYISLFAGIGGFDLALNRQGHVCVYVNEWDKYAAQIYEKNFNHKPDTRDIRAVDASDLPDFDLLCGGFPCQSFSIAGKRGGFQDTRGTLFYDIARIAKVKRPTYLLLENVKGLLSHDNGRTFETIMRAIDELGYDAQWQVLNSKNHGVPQNRERVFIIGHLRGTARPKIFPIRSDSYADIVLPTLTARYWGGQANGGYIGNKTLKVGAYRAQKDGSGKPVILAVDTKQQGPPRFTKDSPTLQANGWKEPIKVLQNMKIRRLTPIECERLQGFPDNWTEGISDTQRYKCLGNAVTVNVVEAIAECLRGGSIETL